MTYRQLLTLSKVEKNKRLKFKCVHRHNGLTHSPCYDQAHGLIEKVGYLDIETSNLSSDFGCILSYCIGDDNEKLIGRVLTPQEIKSGIYDKILLKELCADLKRFTRIITYYGSRFDIPFCRSRSLLYHLPFPTYKTLWHTDAYLVVKYKLGTLHSRRLGVVAPFYGISAKGHPLNPTVWLKCLSGNQNALNFVWSHNKEDVITLKRLWHKISQYTKLNRTSI